MSKFKLIVKQNGIVVNDGSLITLNTDTIFKITLQSLENDECYTNEVDFIVKKSNSLPIKHAEIIDCLENIDQNLINDKINEIKNGTSAVLSYSFNGNPIQESEILKLISTKKNGVIVVSTTDTCPTSKNLTFSVIPGFSTTIPIEDLVQTCVEANRNYIFPKTTIENHLKSILGNQNLEFKNIEDTPVNANSERTIIFEVREPNGCWSEEMTLKLIVKNVPNFSDKTDELKYCQNHILTINEEYIKGIFGNSIVNYAIKIDGQTFDWNSSITKTLNFVTNSINIDILIYNEGNESCPNNVTLTLNKKESEYIFTPNNTYLKSKTINFCKDDKNNAITQIQNHIDLVEEITGLNPLLSAEEIYQLYQSSNNNVLVDFNNSIYCNPIKINFIFNETERPSITLPTAVLCSEETYFFDVNEIVNDDNLEIIISQNGNILTDYYLKAGIYDVTVKNKDTTCETTYKFEVKAAPKPIIEKIVISNNQIIVHAKGEGTIEYALFDDFGNIIRDWQTSNVLDFPKNLFSKKFIVRVRLNNCGITERKGVNILDIPNFISPNSDGVNDELLIYDTQEYMIQIFDRYGQIVFEKEGENTIKWDGKKNGKTIPSDTYWYTIKPLNSFNDLQVQYTGSILVKHK